MSKLSKSDVFTVTGAAIMGLFIVTLLISWPYNLYKLVISDFEAPYKSEVIRGIAVFPIPILAPFVAYVDIGDEK